MKTFLPKSPNGSFLGHELAKKSYVFTLVKSADAKGAPTFFYLAVQADKWDAFKLALKKGNFDAKDFGAVLYSDYGQPTDLVQKTVEEYYGISLSDLGAVA